MRGEHQISAPSNGGVLMPSHTSGDPGFYAKKRAREAEIGRELTTEEFLVEHYEASYAPTASGTSIFDPVLCEIAYRWFCPQGGTVLDPFAGGSVRGIVASRLGYRYVGIELRQEQVEANRRAIMHSSTAKGRQDAVPYLQSATSGAASGRFIIRMQMLEIALAGNRTANRRKAPRHHPSRRLPFNRLSERVGEPPLSGKIATIGQLQAIVLAVINDVETPVRPRELIFELTTCPARLRDRPVLSRKITAIGHDHLVIMAVIDDIEAFVGAGKLIADFEAPSRSGWRHRPVLARKLTACGHGQLVILTVIDDVQALPLREFRCQPISGACGVHRRWSN